MHRQLDESTAGVNRADVASLVSTNPVTGEDVWAGPIGDAGAEVAAARAPDDSPRMTRSVPDDGPLGCSRVAADGSTCLSA